MIMKIIMIIISILIKGASAILEFGKTTFLIEMVSRICLHDLAEDVVL